MVRRTTTARTRSSRLGIDGNVTADDENNNSNGDTQPPDNTQPLASTQPLDEANHNPPPHSPPIPSATNDPPVDDRQPDPPAAQSAEPEDDQSLWREKHFWGGQYLDKENVCRHLNPSKQYVSKEERPGEIYHKCEHADSVDDCRFWEWMSDTLARRKVLSGILLRPVTFPSGSSPNTFPNPWQIKAPPVRINPHEELRRRLQNEANKLRMLRLDASIREVHERYAASQVPSSTTAPLASSLSTQAELHGAHSAQTRSSTAQRSNASSVTESPSASHKRTNTKPVSPYAAQEGVSGQVSGQLYRPSSGSPSGGTFTRKRTAEQAALVDYGGDRNMRRMNTSSSTAGPPTPIRSTNLPAGRSARHTYQQVRTSPDGIDGGPPGPPGGGHTDLSDADPDDLMAALLRSWRHSDRPEHALRLVRRLANDRFILPTTLRALLNSVLDQHDEEMEEGFDE